MVLIMRTNDEIYDIVMDRKDEYEARKRARNKRVGAISAAVVAIAICVTAGIAAQRGAITSKKAEGGANSEATYPEISVYEEEQTQKYRNLCYTNRAGCADNRQYPA